MKFSTLKLPMLGVLFISLSMSAQNSEKKYTGIYTWKTQIEMQKATYQGDSVIGQSEMSKFKQRFVVIREIEEDYVLIRILDYTCKAKNMTIPVNSEENTKDVKVAKGDKVSNFEFLPTPNFYVYNFSGSPDDFYSLSDEKRNARSYDTLQTYFLVSKSDIDNNTYYREKVTLALGVINFPFKARVQSKNEDFSGSFNFGTAIGLKFPRRSYRNWSLSLITGYSLSNINIDTASVQNNKSLLLSNNNFTGFSISAGLLTEFKNIQVGLFIGWDHLTKINQRTFDWDYQGKPWLSVGFGYAIFSNEGARKTNLSKADETTN